MAKLIQYRFYNHIIRRSSDGKSWEIKAPDDEHFMNGFANRNQAMDYIEAGTGRYTFEEYRGFTLRYDSRHGFWQVRKPRGTQWYARLDWYYGDNLTKEQLMQHIDNELRVAESRKVYARPRDSQRQRVYDAEAAARLDSKCFGSLDEIRDYVEQVASTAWWKHRAAVTGIRTIKIMPGRRNQKRALAFKNGRVGEISLPTWAFTERVVLHEMAHLITPKDVPGHGRLFCQNYLAIVERFMGKEAADSLRHSFKKHKVKYTGKD